MPDETIEARLDAVEQLLAQATAALEHLRSDVEIGTRIEAANTREIEKLKRHVAKLQHPDPAPRPLVGPAPPPED